MFHLKDLRRRNVSSSPYLSSRVLESSSSAPNYDLLNENDIPAHNDLHIRSPNNDNQLNIASSPEDSEVEDVLAPGDIIGQGSFLKGDLVSLLPTDRDQLNHDHEDEQFEVLKELGKGSYAVVYLVHQVFFTHGASAPSSAFSRGRSNTAESSENGHILGHMDNEGFLALPKKTLGRKFAIKCLSKANLDKEELDIQMAEVTIHQSLPLHSNIVALHKTLQTSSYLLLVLEYVPGEDLFYFLEQSRDHYPSSCSSSSSPIPSPLPSPMPASIPYPFSDSSESSSQLLFQQQTPPTPSLLSSSHPSHLLSRTRLRLIASMFAQMCDAVATCHAAGVFHRDIKPENFIVTDGRYLNEATDMVNGRNNKGRVVVKLTDFGLSTKEEECADMDCGSAPYMSYECRNNIAPTYRPREADVWSLGIVLINMLYHINPWTDTAYRVCPSFTAFRQDPVGFFMSRFTGMTLPVAEVLACRVFYIDDGQTKVNGRVKENRMTASELGVWVRSSLVDLLVMDESSKLASGGGGASTVRAVVNGGHRLSLQMRISHRPVSRAASPFGGRLGSIGGVGGGAVTSPRLLSQTLSRAPSLAPALEKEERETETDVEREVRIQEEQEQIQQQEDTSPSPSRTSKRRKRGLRNKGKGVTSATTTVIKGQEQDETPKTLADVQSLAREISNASKPPSVHHLQLRQQPSSSSLFAPLTNYVNGDNMRMSSTSLPSPGGVNGSEDTPMKIKLGNGSGEGNTMLTVLSPSMMLMAPSTAGTSTIKSSSSSLSLSVKSSANSSNSARTASKGSSLRSTATTTTKTAINGSGNFTPIYAPSALLSKPVGLGEEGSPRTPSQLSSSRGTGPSSAGSASGSGTQTQQQQPQAVVKKSSKWTLRFGKNNNNGLGGNNIALAPPSSPTISATPASVATTRKKGGSLPIPIPIGSPGHLIAFTAAPHSEPAAAGISQTPAKSQQPLPQRTPQSHPYSTMSPTATNVTNVIMGLNPASSQQFHQNGSNVSLVGTSGGNRGRRARAGTGDATAMAILSGAAVGSSPYKPKNSSRSPGPSHGVPRSPGGFVSSASSSSASLVSGAGSGVELGQGQGKSQKDGWVAFQEGPSGYWRDKRYPDRTGTENRGMGYIGGGSGVSGGSRDVTGGLSPSGATGFGAGGGRHGSVGAAGGPFAKSASSVIMGPAGGSWRSGTGASTTPLSVDMSVVNSSASSSASASGGASLHGSVSVSGSASPGGSTSAFTRYSNSSLSVSTMATSVSSGSGKANWRNGGGRGGAALISHKAADVGVNIPKNVKIMDGVPRALNEPPRGQHPDFGFAPPSPVRKARTRNKKGNNSSNNNNLNSTTSAPTSPTANDTLSSIAAAGISTSKDLNKLDTIIERPLTSDSSMGRQEDATSATTITSTGVTAIGGSASNMWKDASTSTTDLAAGNAVSNGSASNDDGIGAGRVKKVHKGQINTLAKMLSALRR